MKRLLFILSLFLTIALNGQILPGVVAGQTAEGNSYCAEYQAVYNAMTNKPTEAIAVSQNTMVQSIVTAGVWTKLDLFYLFAQYSNTSGEALINWISPGTYNCTNVHATAWVSLEGFTGDGTNDFLNTNWIPSTNHNNYTQNSASIGFYVRNTLNEVKYITGVTDNSSTIEYYPRLAGTNGGRINDMTAADFTYAGGNGMYFLVRTASNVTNSLHNNTSLGTGSVNSTGLPTTYTLYILGKNNSGTLSYPSQYQMSQYCLGASLNTTERMAVQNAVETYMDSNGKGVIAYLQLLDRFTNTFKIAA